MIIQKNGIKREIDLPMQLCLSRVEVDALVDALNRATQDNHYYGWIDLVRVERETGGVSVKPISWTAGA